MVFDRTFLLTAGLVLIAGGVSLGVQQSTAATDYVASAVKDGGRPFWDIWRDAARKPAEVISFSQIKPGMIVVDLVPDDGYYTRILSKLVGPKGKVYALVPNGGGGASRSSRMAQRQGQAPAVVPKDTAQACVLGCYETGQPAYVLSVDQVLAIQNITEYANVTVLWEELGQYGGILAIPDQADAVITVDGYHALHTTKTVKLPSYLAGRESSLKPLDVAAFDKAVFRALKPGGVYLVADHSASKGAGFTVADTLHRTDADAVKAEIIAAGFALDGESTALSRADDNHSKSADGTAAERDATDHYVLRFKKPANALAADKRPKDDPLKNYYGNTIIHGVGPDGVTTSNGIIVEGRSMQGVTNNGQRLRYSFFNSDHTYQEFGRLGEGPGPMQSGVWYWDADGHNCEIHQFPLDERANVVCHSDDYARPVGVVQDQELDGSGRPTEIVPGHNHLPPKGD